MTVAFEFVDGPLDGLSISSASANEQELQLCDRLLTETRNGMFGKQVAVLWPRGVDRAVGSPHEDGIMCRFILDELGLAPNYEDVMRLPRFRLATISSFLVCRLKSVGRPDQARL